MNYLDNFYSGGVSFQAAQTAGYWEASQGYTPADQGSYESHAAYTTRINAWHYANSQNV